MAKTEFKYGDKIPHDVKELQTVDGDLVFVRRVQGKGWDAAHARWTDGYENDGSLLWEWAQANPLVAPQSKLEKAKAYFSPLSTYGIEERLQSSSVARDYAATIIRSC